MLSNERKKKYLNKQNQTDKCSQEKLFFCFVFVLFTFNYFFLKKDFVLSLNNLPFLLKHSLLRFSAPEVLAYYDIFPDYTARVCDCRKKKSISKFSPSRNITILVRVNAPIKLYKALMEARDGAF